MKLIFYNKKFICNVMHYIILVIALERFHIIMHSGAAHFKQKCVFIKFTTFFISRTKQIYAKTKNVVSESILKMKVKSCWPFSKFCLSQKFICKEILLCEHKFMQYFKTINTMTFTKTILENPYKVIKKPSKLS